MPPMMTGRAAKEILVKNIAQQGLSLELFYAFVIIACSLMIYFGTKELYKLTSHKGIGYFRNAFLFFALAYFSKVFLRVILDYNGIARLLDISPRAMGGLVALISLPLFIYFSAIAVFYLALSVVWKKLEHKNIGAGVFHLTAGLLGLVGLISRSQKTYFILNLIFFFVVLGVVYLSKGKAGKKSHNLYIIYFLLLIFWILNILDILVPNFLRGLQLFIYLASTGVFMTILYKVLKRTGAK